MKAVLSFLLTICIASAGCHRHSTTPGWKNLDWDSPKSLALAKYQPRWNQPELLTIENYDYERDQQVAGAPWRLLLTYKDDHLVKASISRVGNVLDLDAEKMREALAAQYGSPVLQHEDKHLYDAAKVTLFKSERAAIKLEHSRILQDEILSVEYTPPKPVSGL